MRPLVGVEWTTPWTPGSLPWGAWLGQQRERESAGWAPAEAACQPRCSPNWAALASALPITIQGSSGQLKEKVANKDTELLGWEKGGYSKAPHLALKSSLHEALGSSAPTGRHPAPLP